MPSTPLDPKLAVARARKSVRFERRTSSNGEPVWYTIDRRTKSGIGVYGPEEKGRDNHEKDVMFRALKRIDSTYDWHEHDWHTLTGPAEDRVAQMLAWREEWEVAKREYSGFQALVNLVIADARRAGR